MNLFRCLILIAVLVLVAVPNTVFAQTGEAQEAVPTEVPDGETGNGTAEEEDEAVASFFGTTTVTATGSEIETFKVATPVTVVSAEEIERKSPDNAADLLRGQPGVDVNGVGPNQARPIIRGQRGLRVLFLENGLRMNNARRQSDFGEIPALVDMDTVQTMEVVRGPASVLYGSDAIGGVLNLITKVPPYGDGPPVGGGVALRYADAGESVRGQVGVHGRFERTSFGLGLSYRDAEAYDAPSGSFGNITLDTDTPVNDTGVQDDSLYGYFSYDLDDSQTLEFRLSRYSADETGFGFVDPEVIGETSRIRLFYPYQDVNRYSIGYNGSALELPIADSVELRAYYQNNEREFAQDLDINIGPLAPVPGWPDSALEYDAVNYTDLETFGLRGEAIKVAGTKNIITYGIEYFEDDSFNTDHSVEVFRGRFPFPPFEFTAESTSDLTSTPYATNTSYGVFVQDEIYPVDNLTLSIGARFQNVETKAKPTPGWDITGLDFDDDSVVYAINAVYSVQDYLNLVASYGTAFRAPNIIERLFNGPTAEGSGYQILNPDLVSEESDNIDVGFKYLRNNAYLNVTYFENNIDKGIIQDFLSDEEIAALPQDVQDDIEASGQTLVVQQRNSDELIYEGIELATGYLHPNGISVGGNYTHLSGERRGFSPVPVGNQIADKINFHVRYDRPKGKYWVEYRLRHNGEEDVQLDPGDPEDLVGPVLPSFTIHTLSGGVTLVETDNQRHTLGLVIDNFTDELYAEFSNVTFFRPQPGRNIIATYRVSL